MSPSPSLSLVYRLCVVHTQYSILARQDTQSDGVTYLMPYHTGHGIVMVVRLGQLDYKVSGVQCSAEWGCEVE